MLFKYDDKSLKFRLVGLSPKETEEIRQLITDNGGEICSTRGPPVMTFSDSNTIRAPGEPLFHVDYVRDCVRQNQLFQLVDYIIGPQGYFGCLQCIFTHGTNVCQSHYNGPPDFRPRPLSTQDESCSKNIKQGKSPGPNASMECQVPAAVGSAAEMKNEEKSGENQAKPTTPLIKQEPDTVKTEETTVGPITDDVSSSDDDSSSAAEDRVPSAATSGKVSPKESSGNRWGRCIRKMKKSRTQRRGNIGKAEQRRMVDYLISNDMISQAKGFIPWRKMVKEGLTQRSVGTLNSHFRKLLLPKIHTFPMTERQLSEFRKLVPK